MKQRYDSYKPSSIDWIGEIPSHWTVIPVKYVLDNLDYLRQPISAEDRERNNPQYDYYGASGVIDQIDYYNVEDTVLLIGEDGANLVMRNLPLIYKASGKFWVNNHAHILKPQNGYDYSYLAHLLEAGDYTLFITGSAQPKLSQENLNKYPICIPPLAEQEAIAAWLDEKCDEIDAAIAKVDREIELIDELKQSKISRVVTRGLNPDTPLRPSGIDWIGNIPEHWKIVPIKSLGFFTKGLTFTKADLADEGKSVISYGQIHSKLNDKVGIRRELIRYIPDRICLNNASSLTKKGDFIFADTSEDLQGCGNAVYNDTLIPLYGGYHTIILHSFSEDNKYFGYLFLTDAWRSQIRASVSGVKVYSITQSILKNCNILVPPLSEQQAIADYLDKKCAEIDGLKEKLSMKRETLTELRQSIISEVVTGKRKVI